MAGLSDKDAEEVQKTLEQLDNIEDAVATEDLEEIRNLTNRIRDKGALETAEGRIALQQEKEKSDGSTAGYYELPEGAKEIQHLISYKNMNAQMGEIFRAVYRYGQVEHSEKLRDAKKIKYYIEAEIERIEKYGE